MTLCEPGPHAFLLLIQLGHFTERERHVMDTLQKMLCSNVNLFTIVLFTYGDKLKSKSLDQFVSEDKYLQKLTQKCGSQYHVFNNTDRENTCQVSELFKKVDSQLRMRNKKYYVRTNNYGAKKILEYMARPGECTSAALGEKQFCRPSFCNVYQQQHTKTNMPYNAKPATTKTNSLCHTTYNAKPATTHKDQ